MLKGLFKKISQVFTTVTLDEDFIAELEETLVLSDVAMATTEKLIESLRQQVKKERPETIEQAKALFKREMARVLGTEPAPLQFSPQPPTVWLILGVNGTGKTTSIGKLANLMKQQGYRPLLVAADTFRAAAIEQLQIWGQRVDAPVIAHRPGADPAAVVFDAVRAARSRGHDLVLVDTAGRLHTKHNLMAELEKVSRVVERETGRQPDESLLVLDATTGQNGLAQASAFTQSVPLTGIILTKLDGTAKGGIVITIADQLHLPVKLVGTGEKIGDLAVFDPQEYVEALME
ncbi:MAG: signal recognition particle-docking protein FtsY [Abditibacteriales bacterium]|nr:signal recognition particle-docking protein FtsY [Abditibacteriales bacterium]MDW8368089.1 signal recognition particle-docking protein FtsY [Abditibacteriales bacterium]